MSHTDQSDLLVPSSGVSFLTSRFPPVPLVRPLEVFGKSFCVELSSALTLGPNTVLRAAIGKSIQTLLREKGLLLPLKQLHDGFLGRHQLSSTTKATVRAAVRPVGDWFVAVFDGAAVPAGLCDRSDWEGLAEAWGPTSSDNLLDVIVTSFIELDQFARSVATCTSADGREAGKQMFDNRFGQVLPAWRELCPDVSLEGCLRIESNLLVVMNLETIARASAKPSSPWVSPTAELLDATSKPVGNWLRQLALAVKCTNNRELADLLARKEIYHHRGRAITHDTLKGWSAMKPGMLMSLAGCDALLRAVSNVEVAVKLRSRFVLARFLAFLCDFLRSSVRSVPPSWPEAQRMLLTRFRQLSS